MHIHHLNLLVFPPGVVVPGATGNQGLQEGRDPGFMFWVG